MKYTHTHKSPTTNGVIIVKVCINGHTLLSDVSNYRQSILGFVLVVVIRAVQQQVAPAVQVAHLVPASWAKCDDQTWAAGQFDLTDGVQTVAQGL